MFMNGCSFQKELFVNFMDDTTPYVIWTAFYSYGIPGSFQVFIVDWVFFVTFCRDIIVTFCLSQATISLNM